MALNVDKPAFSSDKDQRSCLLEIIFELSKQAIPIIDSKIKKQKPLPLEYDFLDLFAESFFSIQSFCILMQEGLVSAAAAIVRIALEQISIISILSAYPKAKDAFFSVKKERNEYYTSDKNYQSDFKQKINEEKSVDTRKIKQYFDYGWCDMPNGKKATSLKEICLIAETSEIYEMVDDFINSFSHGQLSIYRFRRISKDLSDAFVNSLFYCAGVLFFKLLGVFSRECDSKALFTEGNKAKHDLAYSVFAKLSAETNKSAVVAFAKEGTNKKGTNVKRLYQIIVKLVGMLDETSSLAEKYFLSQSYIMFSRQLIIVILKKLFTERFLFCDNFSLKNYADYFKNTTIEKEYGQTAALNIKDLFATIDSIDDRWVISNEEIDYYFTFSLNSLLTILFKELESKEVV